jgi:hypothetical protein
MLKKKKKQLCFLLTKILCETIGEDGIDLSAEFNDKLCFGGVYNDRIGDVISEIEDNNDDSSPADLCTATEAFQVRLVGIHFIYAVDPEISKRWR